MNRSNQRLTNVSGWSQPHESKVSLINDGRAWFPSAAVKYGLGVDFYIVRFFSMGIDLAFVNGFHDTFRIDNEEDVSTSPVGGSAGSFSFAPTAKLTFHFGTED